MKSKKGLIILCLAMLASIFLMIVARRNESLSVDRVLAKLVTGIFKEHTYPFFEAVTQLGDTVGVVIVVVIIMIVLWAKQRNYIGMLVLFIAVLLGNEVNKWIKELVGRERPLTAVDAESLSFPSGHAMVGLILYMLGSYLLIKSIKTVSLKWLIGTIAFIIIILIGLSRLVLQDHFSTDVLGGFAIGIVWTMLWIFLYKWLYVRFPKKRS